MFKKLKSQVQEAVSTAAQLANTSLSAATSNNLETVSNSTRSRVNSMSSVTSDSAPSAIFSNYSTPQRNFYPPSDIESELENEQQTSFIENANMSTISTSSPPSTHEAKKLHKLLEVYKTKYTQLKNAYIEVETEKEKVKKVLSESQDKVLKRVQDLKEQLENEKLARALAESTLRSQLVEKEEQINELKGKINNKNGNFESNGENLIDLNKGGDENGVEGGNSKTKKLENLLAKCRELIKDQKEQLASKESVISEQKEQLARLANACEERDETKKLIQNSDEQLKKSKVVFEEREAVLNEKNSVLMANVEKLQKRLADLNSELEEKGNLFQKQFQLFQVEFNEKEDGLKNKLKLLQDDYFNLERELIQEREKNSQQAGQEVINSKMGILEAINKQLESRVHTVETELDVRNEQVTRLQAQNDEYLHDFELLKKDFDEKFSLQLKKELDASESQKNGLVNLQMKLENETKEKNEHAERLTQVETEFNRFKQNLNEIVKEKNSLSEDLESFKSSLSKSESENQNLSQRLTQTMSEKESQLMSLQETLDQSKNNHINELNMLNSELNTVKQSMNEITRENNSLIELLETFKKNLNKNESETQSLNQQLTERLSEKERELEQKKDSYLDEINLLQCELNDLKATLSQSEAKFEQKEIELRALEQKVTELNEGLSESNENLEKKKTELNAFQMELSDLKQSMVELNERLSNSKSDVTDKEAEIEKIKTNHANELGSLQAELNSLRQGSGDLSEMVAKFQSEISGLKEALASEEAKSEKSKAKHVNELNALQTELSGLSEQFSNSKREVSDLNESLAQKEINHTNELNVLKSELNGLRQGSGDLNETLNKLDSEIQSLKQTLAEKTLELENCKAFHVNESNELQTELSNLKNSANELNESLTQKKEELEKNNIAHATELSSMQTILNDLRQGSGNLNETVTELNKQISQQSDALAEKEANLYALEAELSSLRQSAKEMSEQLSKSKNDLAQKDTELNGLKQGSGSLNDTVLKLKEALADKETELEQSRTNHTNEVSFLKSELTSMKENLNEAIRENESLDKQRSELESKLNQFESSANEAIENDRSLIEGLNRKLSLKEGELKDLVGKFEGECDVYETKLNALQKELEYKHAEKVANLKKKLKEELEAKQDEVDLVRKELIESHQNELATVRAGLLSEIEALKTEMEQVKASKVENEKNMLDKNAQLNGQLKRSDETVNGLKAAVKCGEESLLAKQRQVEELTQRLQALKEKSEQDDVQVKENDEKCMGYLKQINELSENLNSAYFEKINAEKVIREAYESSQAKLIAEKEESVEAACRAETELSQIRAQFKQKVDEETQSLRDKLANKEIDLSSMRDKLNESLKDYRASIDKLKAASNQRAQRMKKKLLHSQAVLGLIEKNFFNSQALFFSQFVSHLTEGNNKAGDDEAAVTAVSLEFDEAKFAELIEIKRAELEHLRETAACERQLSETVEQLRDELDTVRTNSVKTESKLKEESEKSTAQFKREVDDLQLKLANLDLKTKQATLDENRELHSLKKKVITLEEELLKARKENSYLTEQQKSSEESAEKSLLIMRQKADLKIASMKKQLENEKSSKIEELNSKNYELELKINEQSKLIDMIKTDSDSCASKLSQLDEEMQSLSEEKTQLKLELANKDKHYEAFIDELNEKFRKKQETDHEEIEQLKRSQNSFSMSNSRSNQNDNGALNGLRMENHQLSKQLDELKMSYDELKDEKTQLYLSFNELKNKSLVDSSNSSSSQSLEVSKLNVLLRDKDRLISDLESRLANNKPKAPSSNSYSTFSPSFDLNYTSPLNNSNGKRSLMAELSDPDSSKNFYLNSCLENTEIDYLRQIVASYMMGTDPLTMAKVIVAVLKFPEEEKRKLIENEKSKHSNWFPNLISKQQ